MSATVASPQAAPPAPGAAPVSSAAIRARNQALRMCLALKRLLDKVQGSRRALPHLATLETALVQQGVAALDVASAKTLAKMHTQLRVLPLDAADGPMQDLLEHVRRALKRKAALQTHQLSPNDPESTVVIMETSHSEFMDALSQVRTITPGMGLRGAVAETPPAASPAQATQPAQPAK